VDKVLAVDGSDNLWMAVRDLSFRGVASLQNGGAIDSTAAFLLTTSNGLPSNGVQTVIVDQDNTVWVGTDAGIAIITDPTNPMGQNGIAAYKPLLGVSVNCITVDPLNQKWVGTPEGVVVFSPDGTSEIATYSVESTNGQLIDNDIRSIAIDRTSGTVYFASAPGLASLTTSFAAGAVSVTKLLPFPNPFYLPTSTPLTIKGFLSGSSLKILSVNGSLVREIRTPGGGIGQWDGLDKNGNFVASGVYFLVGYSTDGSVVKGKVAVIRRQ
jgi:hypothetical protein